MVTHPSSVLCGEDLVSPVCLHPLQLAHVPFAALICLKNVTKNTVKLPAMAPFHWAGKLPGLHQHLHDRLRIFPVLLF